VGGYLARVKGVEQNKKNWPLIARSRRRGIKAFSWPADNRAEKVRFMLKLYKFRFVNLHVLRETFCISADIGNI
jgi:hypothetical protein